MDKTVIFVIGMGRSGTSVLSRVLSLCGGVLPEQLVEALDSNPRGHWEPREALELNQRFLADHGSSWFDPSPDLSIRIASGEQEVAGFVAEIRALLRSWPTGRFLVVKEPRITALAECWFEAARREGYAVKVVIPVRHPDEVAMSLAARDDLPEAHAALLWLKYGLLAERCSRGLPRVFVAYRSLIGDWRREVPRIAAALELDFSPADADAIDAFLTSSLYRQRRPPQARPAPILPAVGAVYDAFSAAAMDAPIDTLALDRLFDGYVAYARVWPAATESFILRHRPPTPLLERLSRSERHGEALLQRLAEREAEAMDAADTITRLQARRQAMQAEAGAATAQVEGLQAALDEARRGQARHADTVPASPTAPDRLIGSASWRLAGPLRALGRLLRQRGASTPSRR